MAYIEDRYYLNDKIEHEYKFAGHFGAKGEKRGSRKKPTPHQIMLQNEWNRKKQIRRKIELNFQKGDPFITLAYHKGDDPDMEQMEEDLRYLIRNLRTQYRKQGKELKYIYRMEIGKRGGRHIHILMNYIDGIIPLASKYWRGRRPNITETYDLESGQLAEYLTKRPDDEISGQLSFIPKEEQKKYVRYSCSRNLKKPEPERHVCSHRTAERMIRDGIKPTKGYEVIKESIRHFISPYTGYTHLYYKERRIEGTGERIKPPDRSDRPPWEERYG